MPDPADLSGRTLGDFRVVRKLGAGGMGEVYLARQLSLKRDVALKFLRPDLAANPTAVQRFQQEAEAVARLTHANIVQVYTVGELDGRRFMALEFVDGRNLKDYIARKGPLPVPQAVAVLRQAAAALARAADAGLVHRDIKPENLLVTRTGELKVADFGLTRVLAAAGPDDGDKPVGLTQSGMTLGTPLYMSPEQVQGQPADHRSDLYSLGVTAYHLLAGRPPFTGATAFDVAVQHVQSEPPPLAAARPDLPPGLAALVHRLMAKAPEDRPATAREVLRELAAGPKQGVGAGVRSDPPPAKAPNSRRGWLVAVASLTAAALGWRLAGRRPPTSPGLPDVRLPEPVRSGRERELLAVTRDRAAAPPAVFEATLSLGLLYLGERRLDDAERVFTELEGLKPDRPGGGKVAQFVGRLGQAAVLAQRDRVEEAGKQFGRAFAAFPKAQAQFQAERVLIAHPDLARAVADAVNRLADNRHPQALPGELEWLRSPAAFARGPGPGGEK